MWETLFTPSSPVKATKLYRFCLSNKRSPNCQSIFSNCKKCSRTLSDWSSPSRQHKLSDKILTKSLSLFLAIGDCQIAIACLAIGCRKIASEDLAIRHSQNHKQLFSEFRLPKRHRLFSDKRAQNCRIYLAIISSRSPVIISDIRMPNG